MRSISPRRVWHRSMTDAGVLARQEQGDGEEGLLDEVDLGRRRHLGGVVHVDGRPVGQVGDVLDARGGGDERQVELPLQALADDLHVQEAEEPAAETEAESPRRLRLVGDAGVVQPQLLEGFAQVGELVAFYG